MSMADLVAAGAPELPDGFFYRVKSDGFGYIEVEVRERRKRFGSRLHTGVLVRENEPDGLTAIVEACRKAVRRMEDDQAYRLRLLDVSRYLGDHDPKGGR